MFVCSKVKYASAYDTQSILDRKPVDFDRNWFDETSLGTAGGVYPKNESAMDRLGAALEGEFDSVLYLPEVVEGW